MSFHHVPNLVRKSIRKAELPQHKPGLPWENWWIPTPSQLHFLALQLVAVPKLYFLCSRTCCKDLGPNGPNSKHSMDKHLWHVASTTSTVATLPGKTRMASKPSKITTAWWLASNSKNMPVAMKCHINNRQSRASPTQTWIALGNLVATYNFAASFSCTEQSLYLEPFWNLLAFWNPEVVIFAQLLQLQQWKSCELPD